MVEDGGVLGDAEGVRRPAGEAVDRRRGQRDRLGHAGGTGRRQDEGGAVPAVVTGGGAGLRGGGVVVPRGQQHGDAGRVGEPGADVLPEGGRGQQHRPAFQQAGEHQGDGGGRLDGEDADGFAGGEAEVRDAPALGGGAGEERPVGDLLAVPGQCHGVRPAPGLCQEAVHQRGAHALPPAVVVAGSRLVPPGAGGVVRLDARAGPWSGVRAAVQAAGRARTGRCRGQGDVSTAPGRGSGGLSRRRPRGARPIPGRGRTTGRWCGAG